jgi:hypothetical protein
MRKNLSKDGIRHCYRCDQFKPESEFYKHGDAGQGFSSACKVCEREKERAWRLNNPEAAKRKHRSRDPVKMNARRLVRAAIQNGSLKRLPCEKCAAANAEAHHDDYSVPLNVRWLCKEHHAEHHWNEKCQQRGYSNRTERRHLELRASAGRKA